MKRLFGLVPAAVAAAHISVFMKVIPTKRLYWRVSALGGDPQANAGEFKEPARLDSQLLAKPSGKLAHPACSHLRGEGIVRAVCDST